jgi:hypothetical protein
VDCGDYFVRDDRVVRFPQHFRVRFYDQGLQYTKHLVVSYPTDCANMRIYCVQKTQEKVTVWVDKDVIVARNESPSRNLIVSHTLDTPIIDVVRDALTFRHRLVTLEEEPERLELTLF